MNYFDNSNIKLDILKKESIQSALGGGSGWN